MHNGHPHLPRWLALAVGRLRLYGRWWVARGWDSPRAWRSIAIGVAALAVLLTLFRQPLANLLWPETRIQQLLDDGRHALRQGHLSAADGSGARELFEAAAALDPDRGDVRDALADTGKKALEQARQRLAAGDANAAREALELAGQLQVPQAELEAIAARLRHQGQEHDAVGDLLRRAEDAQAQGRLDDGPDSALPLYQRVLAVRPDHLRALQGKDDALSDLLAEAVAAAQRNETDTAARLLRQVEGYDAGHSELPAARAALNAALDRRRAQAARDLARGRLHKAADGYRQVLAAADDPAARQGLQQVARAWAGEAARLAGDFHFEQAGQALEQARALAPDSPEVAAAAQALQRAQGARQALETRLPAAERERRVRALLAQVESAAAQGQWLLPPGASAYDRFKAAQALAPRDARVKRAGARILPAARDCLEVNLQGNRLQAARTCLDAWQALAPGDPLLPAARRRLAQRWLAVGSERLGAGDIAFASRALEQARELDAATPELPAFAERLGNAKR
ncbi:hypothetical protein [Stenotrophomonas sp. MYb238]|uniref:hypothetical protein n=1 Tax=Stenotrophomonas sp. MYb238 TaxID=2040281 RepID=UPI001D171848|nr:hypothetical protein [Stenotrophomonas sp. MYb238]